MKLRVKYKVTEAGRFLGHLDMTRTIMKTINRANLPVMLSEGFNPHLRLSFAMPLSVGHIGGGEFFEVDLEERIDGEEFKRIFNEFTPFAIEVLEATEVKEKQDSMSSTINSAKYLLTFNKTDCKALREAIDKILAKKEIVIMKKSKSKVKETDIRPFIYDIIIKEEKNEKCIVEALISHGGTNNLRVQDLLSLFALEGVATEEVSVERKGLFVKKGDIYFDLIEILTNVG